MSNLMNDIEKRKELLGEVPKKPQRQDSTTTQLLDLIAVGNKLGMQDATRLITDAFLSENQQAN